MNSALYTIISLILAGGILRGISLMSSPATAVKGNRLGALCMGAAIVLVLIHEGIVSYQILWLSMLVGGVIGGILAMKVKMIQMPQTVALLNGFGGGSSALVGVAVLVSHGTGDPFSKGTAMLALIVGGITFSGSLVAAGKLAQKISQRPVSLAGHNIYSYLTLAVLVVMIILAVSAGQVSPSIMIISALTALALGILATIRVGGADMPITISLLNSLSGVAGSIAGMAISDVLLVAVGGIVGASGLLLTQIMCRAMNRSLVEIMTGKTVLTKPAEDREASQDSDSPELYVKDANPVQTEETGVTPVQPGISEMLADAQKVIIIPGYGMALAQAQYQVKQLSDLLEARGKEVKFAIHPVAGRMPGHMNVLLAEVDVSYDKLYEMDAINPEFQATDVVIVVGANDVVNPAANTAEGTPIYGMPILRADQAQHIIVCNRDNQPGYAGVENPLYTRPNVTLFWGDAADTLTTIIQQFDGCPSPVE